MKRTLLSFCSAGNWGLTGPSNMSKMAQPGKGRRDPCSFIHFTAFTRKLNPSENRQESCPRQNEIRRYFVPAELEGDAPVWISRSCDYPKPMPKKKKKAAPSSSYMMKDKPKLNIPEIHYRIPSFRSGIRMGKGVEGVVEGESWGEFFFFFGQEEQITFLNPLPCYKQD